MTTLPYRLDPHGFPAVDCGRCGGTGTIARFGRVCKGVCFACHGSGCAYPTAKVRTMAGAWRNMLRKAHEVSADPHVEVDAATGNVTRTGGMESGQVVRRCIRHHDGHEEPWRTVSHVRRTARIMYGHAATEHLPCHVFAMESVVTFTDGSTVRLDAMNWEAKPSAGLLAEGARMAEEAREGYDKLIARRAARQERRSS